MEQVIEYQSNGQPIYSDFNDLRAKLGYKVYTPRIGSLGKALLRASKEKHQRSIGWLRHQLDELFRKQRQEDKKLRKNDSKK